MSTLQSLSVLRTSRLDLRELDFNDAEFILRLLNEEGFIRFIGDKGVRTLADARDYILQGPMDSYARNGFGLYAACLRDATPIGICGLVKREGLDDPDVGFAFLSRYWSLGYAVESAAAVLAHAQDVLGLERVVAITSPDNWSSIGVLEKIGLKFERMIRLVDHSPELKLFGVARAGTPQ
jgi:RimJ/RimL family protein N-acetyltransferase